MEQQLEQERILLEKESGLHLATDAYEGPFELILELIEKKKLSINELSLAQITDDYITHVRGKEHFPMEDAAEFISVAATLLVIKSKSLIPELELTEEESLDVSEFERRLREYEHIRSLTRELSKLFGVRICIEAGEKPLEPIFSPSRDLTMANLTSALQEVLAEKEAEERLPEARVRTTITLEEMMERLMTRIQQKVNMSFKEFSAGTTERVEIIVSFLALLELMKQGNVDAEQYGNFGEIQIKNTTTDIPRYG